MKKIELKQSAFGGLFALPFLATAVMLTVIQAPMNFSILAWFAYVPFILSCRPQVKTSRLFWISLLVSFLYWSGNLYWIFPITIIGWLVLCLYIALLWPVLALCLRFCRSKKIPLFIATAVLIVGTERMQGLFLGGFFWRFLAHSQYRNITIIQIADIFGAGGVSFLIAMVNGLIAEILIVMRDAYCVMRKKETSERNTRYAIRNTLASTLLKTMIVAVALGVSFGYGRWRIGQEAEFIEQGPAAASLQSNIPQSVKRSFQSSDILFSDLMEKSNAAVLAGAELIVWPETMVQAILDTETWAFMDPNIADSYAYYHNALAAHARGGSADFGEISVEDSAYLLIGAYGGEIEVSTEIELGMLNSAFLYTPQGRQYPEKYDKIHLVPFGEVLPFRKTFPSVYNFLMKFTPYDYDYSLEYGQNYTVFEMEANQGQKYQFSVMICYEDVVPEIGRKFALDENREKRIDWLINISNDGWFVRFTDDQVIPSTELAQHAAVCVFRAVENRSAVLRSVNTGISCLIDSYGRIKDGYIEGNLPNQAIKRTGVEGWFTDNIPIDKRTSFFSKYGEWLDFFCEFCVFLLIIVMILTKFLRFRNKKVKK